nr:hypothetical protein [Mucilaginibacter sp. X4EP1]
MFTKVEIFIHLQTFFIKKQRIDHKKQNLSNN